METARGLEAARLEGLIQGSLHCAADGETVCRFGRDDVLPRIL
jgi:hypothetical protein